MFTTSTFRIILLLSVTVIAHGEGISFIVTVCATECFKCVLRVCVNWLNKKMLQKKHRLRFKLCHF